MNSYIEDWYEDHKGSTGMSIASRLLEHIGHRVVIVTYADENVALECNECSEVIHDEMYEEVQA